MKSWKVTAQAAGAGVQVCAKPVSYPASIQCNDSVFFQTKGRIPKVEDAQNETGLLFSYVSSVSHCAL